MRTTTQRPPWRTLYIEIIVVCGLLLISLSGFAQKKTAITSSGNGWSVGTNWDPVGVPADGDTVIIPTGLTMKVKGNVYSTPPCLFIKIMGTVDFDPSGQLDLSANSGINLMAGAQISSNGSSSEVIKIGGVVKYNGHNDGTITGPLYASSSTGNSPNGFSEGVLAIKLRSFTAKKFNNTVVLNWIAASDNDLDKFRIEKSFDGQNWQNIHETGVANAIGEFVNYMYSEPMLLIQNSFYRIASLNADGKISYSRTVPVFLLASGVKLFPNPCGTETQVSWNSSSSSPAYVEVIDANRRTHIKKTVPAGQQVFQIETGNLPAGTYFVSITGTDESRHISTLVVNR